MHTGSMGIRKEQKFGYRQQYYNLKCTLVHMNKERTKVIDENITNQNAKKFVRKIFILKYTDKVRK